MVPVGFGSAFLSGVAGSLVVYLAIYRVSRIRFFLRNPSREWRVLLFDLLVFLACGGIVSALLVDPISYKEAFMGGATWQGIVGGFLAGTEVKIKKVTHDVKEGGRHAY